MMFTYSLPGGLNTRTYFDNEKIKFDPPVYEQRYTTAIRIIEDTRWIQHFKKVVDIGCGDMKLLPLLRRIETIEHILEVDVDGTLLESRIQVAQPLVSDYLRKREHPLRIELFEGSITSAVENLKNVDVVIGLEILEHLEADVLEKVPANIFGFVQPKLVIFSTPNSDFNVLFNPLLPNGFRHFDHKFEWTRNEFQEWSLDICKLYPNYKVGIIGVGNPPPDQKHVGEVTQIAIFARKDILGEELANPIVYDNSLIADVGSKYNEIYAVDFPYYTDERTKEKKIIDEANSVISQRKNSEHFINQDKNIREIPIESVLELGLTLQCSKEEIYNILKNENIEIENDFIILPKEDAEDECDDRFEDFNDWNPYEDIDADTESDRLCDFTRHCKVTDESDSDWD